MSNGIITAGCCCGACATCCSWWSASPAGPVDFTLTFYQNHTMEVLGGQFMQLGYTAWTITATLTKSGSCCDYNTCGPGYANLMRYTADVCEVAATRVSNIYSYGFTRRTCLEDDINACLGLPGCYCTRSPRGCEYTGGFTYDGLLNCTDPCTNYNSPFDPSLSHYRLGDPCQQWNCKKCNYVQPLGQCECECKTVSELLWKKLFVETKNYTATVLGTGTGPVTCGYTGKPLQAGTNAVITIYCGPNPCGGTCHVPQLLFTPRDQTLVSNVLEYDATTNACCPSGYCQGTEPYAGLIPWGSCYSTLSTSTPVCLPEFRLLGKGNLFNSATLTNPIPASTFDITLGFGVQANTNEWGPGYLAYTQAQACENVNRTAVCEKWAWDHSETAQTSGGNPTGSPYVPVFCGNDRLEPIGDNKGCNLVSSRCWGPSWTEKYCMANRSLNSVVI